MPTAPPRPAVAAPDPTEMVPLFPVFADPRAEGQQPTRPADTPIRTADPYRPAACLRALAAARDERASGRRRASGPRTRSAGRPTRSSRSQRSRSSPPPPRPLVAAPDPTRIAPLLPPLADPRAEHQAVRSSSGRAAVARPNRARTAARRRAFARLRSSRHRHSPPCSAQTTRPPRPPIRSSRFRRRSPGRHARPPDAAPDPTLTAPLFPAFAEPELNSRRPLPSRHPTVRRHDQHRPAARRRPLSRLDDHPATGRSTCCDQLGHTRHRQTRLCRYQR